MNKRVKLILSWLVKILGILLAIWLLHRTVRQTGGNFRGALLTASMPFLISAVICYGVVNLITSYRWGLLLEVQGIRLSFWELFRLNMIGVFFSNVIPGSVSGDLVKFAYVIDRAPDKKAACALSMMVDRMIGFTAMLLVGAVSAVIAGFVYPEVVWGNRWVCVSVCFVFLLILADVSVIACILGRRFLYRFALVYWLKKLMLKYLPAPLKEFLLKLTGAVDLYRSKYSSCLVVLAASCGVHLLLAVQNCLIGKAFHEYVMTPLQYVTTTQIGNITGLIPVTPGGMGLRDTVTAKLFAYFGAAPADVVGYIPVCYSIDMVLWGLLGAVLLVCYRTRSE